MKTKAVRLYGVMDLRLEEFELPAISEDEVLLRVVTDSLCASTYKAVKQGSKHKRVPETVSETPIIVGHEMSGEIVQVGAALQDRWSVGQKIVIQPALKLESGYDPGYSYPYIGGAATYAVVPKIVLERNCMIPYEGDAYFKGSLCESLACVIRGYKGFYHTDYSNYVRTDGAKVGGKLAILGGAGPMGLGAVDLACGYAGLSQVVVTDLNEDRLDYARSKCKPEEAAKCGCELIYLNTSETEDPVAKLLEISDGGFDDVFVMVPVPALFTMAEKICREDGCVNFFAGPPIHDMPGSLNLYRVHYDGIHVVGTAGSIPQDMVDIIDLIEKDKIHPGAVVSHILGLNAYIDTLLAMEHPNGAKKVCYNGLDIPLIAVDELDQWADKDPMYGELAAIVKRNGGLWCTEAEEYLLAHAPKI
ncbi:MAG: zinc-binding dehydrogenase [Clostridia bacterium]|nr:zinc-binding dehydrogenase [Clostridia bacterium]MBQ5819666.1 zinc-binding dehydrogenase [Clostridia bacterium]